jgi:flagellar biogenesis protein FliO
MVVALSAIAYGVLVMAKRAGVGRKHGNMALEAHLPLDTRRAVYAVRVANTIYVLGGSEGGLTKLGEISANDWPEPSAAPPLPFAELLKKARGGTLAKPGKDAQKVHDAPEPVTIEGDGQTKGGSDAAG